MRRRSSTDSDNPAALLPARSPPSALTLGLVPSSPPQPPTRAPRPPPPPPPIPSLDPGRRSVVPDVPDAGPAAWAGIRPPALSGRRTRTRGRRAVRPPRLARAIRGSPCTLNHRRASKRARTWNRACVQGTSGGLLIESRVSAGGRIGRTVRVSNSTGDGPSLSLSLLSLTCK